MLENTNREILTGYWKEEEDGGVHVRSSRSLVVGCKSRMSQFDVEVVVVEYS